MVGSNDFETREQLREISAEIIGAIGSIEESIGRTDVVLKKACAYFGDKIIGHEVAERRWLPVRKEMQKMYDLLEEIGRKVEWVIKNWDTPELYGCPAADLPRQKNSLENSRVEVVRF